MKLSFEGENMIKCFEAPGGVPMLEAYVCPAGVLTIGFGTTKGVKFGHKITPNMAHALFMEDVHEAEMLVSFHVNVPLNQNEFDALVSFVYNVGQGNFEDSTMLRLLNEGKPRDVVAKEFDRWIYANGKVLEGLVKRRETERNLFERPTPPNPASHDESVDLKDYP